MERKIGGVGMLIRSQDKKRLLVLENAYEINITQSTVYMFGSNIGEYKTEEKAIKVLDMIQDAYAKCESARTLTTGTVFEIARKSGTQAVVENFKKDHRDNFVFQMPQDSEV